MKRVLSIICMAGGLFFSVYGVLSIYDEFFRYGRMWETPAVKPHEAPFVTLSEGSVPFRGGESVFRESDPKSLMPPFSLLAPDVLKSGEKGYFTFCVQCHGKNYDGMGTVGQSFSPLPVDLKSILVQNKSYGELFYSVSYGIPGGRQPPLASTVSIEDRWKIVGYVKNLGVSR